MNDEARLTNDERMTKSENRNARVEDNAIGYRIEAASTQTLDGSLRAASDLLKNLERPKT